MASKQLEQPRFDRTGRKICQKGHSMYQWDPHAWCAACRNKEQGTDPCTLDKDCNLCAEMTEEQQNTIATKRQCPDRQSSSRERTQSVSPPDTATEIMPPQENASGDPERAHASGRERSRQETGNKSLPGQDDHVSTPVKTSH